MDGRKGRKKGRDRKEAHNANHLLNFDYSTPASHHVSSIAPSSAHRRRKPVKKERYLQSNHRFSFYPDYWDASDSRQPFRSRTSAAIEETNQLFDWDYVMQVYYSYTKPFECAICLYSPTCSRIAPCNHMFCLNCLWAYYNSRLEAVGGRFGGAAPCPVCQASWKLKDYRPATLDRKAEPSVGAPHSLTLLRRDKSNSIAIPLAPLETHTDTKIQPPKLSTPSTAFSTPTPSHAHTLAHTYTNPHPHEELTPPPPALPMRSSPFPLVHSPAAAFNRICVSTVAEVEALVEREACAMETAMQRALSEDETQAARLILDAMDTYKSQTESTLLRVTPPTPPSPTPAPSSSSRTVPPSSTPHTISAVSSQLLDDGTSFFFYQAVDGQRCYLHPINMKWLLQEYGSYSKFPREIRAPIVFIGDEISQDEQSQKRYKFLSYLPVGCNWRFLLLDISLYLSPSPQTTTSKITSTSPPQPSPATLEATMVPKPKATVAVSGSTRSLFLAELRKFQKQEKQKVNRIARKEERTQQTMREEHERRRKRDTATHSAYPSQSQMLGFFDSDTLVNDDIHFPSFSPTEPAEESATIAPSSVSTWSSHSSTLLNQNKLYSATESRDQVFPTLGGGGGGGGGTRTAPSLSQSAPVSLWNSPTTAAHSTSTLSASSSTFSPANPSLTSEANSPSLSPASSPGTAMGLKKPQLRPQQPPQGAGRKKKKGGRGRVLIQF